MESERRWSRGGGTYTGGVLGAISAKGLIIPLSGLRVKIQGLSNPNHKKFTPKLTGNGIKSGNGNSVERRCDCGWAGYGRDELGLTACYAKLRGDDAFAWTS